MLSYCQQQKMKNKKEWYRNNQMGIVIRLSYCQQQKIKNQKEWYRNNQMGIETVNSIPTIRMALTLTYVSRCSLTQRGQVKTLCEVANYQQEIFLDQNI